MWLDDNIESTCPDEAVGSRKGQSGFIHNFGDTDGCRTRNADATVDKRCSAILLSLFYTNPISDVHLP